MRRTDHSQKKTGIHLRFAGLQKQGPNVKDGPKHCARLLGFVQFEDPCHTALCEAFGRLGNVAAP
jgi:hypothetical protein